MRKEVILLCLMLGVIGYAKAQNWETDIEQAKSLALKQSQNIVLVFKGSDWCAPCIKLDREIFDTEEFKKYAESNFVLLEADFPRRKKNKLDAVQEERNNKLAEKYNKEGYFPLVVVLDKNGKVLGKTGYKKTSPTEYIKVLASY